MTDITKVTINKHIQENFNQAKLTLKDTDLDRIKVTKCELTYNKSDSLPEVIRELMNARKRLKTEDHKSSRENQDEINFIKLSETDPPFHINIETHWLDKTIFELAKLAYPT